MSETRETKRSVEVEFGVEVRYLRHDGIEVGGLRCEKGWVAIEGGLALESSRTLDGLVRKLRLRRSFGGRS